MPQGVDFKYYRYTDDTGTKHFTVRKSKYYGEIADLGFAAFNSADEKLPNGWKMRYVLILDPLTGNRRKVECGTVGCDVFTGAQTTIDLPIIDSEDDVTYSVTLAVGERKSRGHPVQNL